MSDVRNSFRNSQRNQFFISEIAGDSSGFLPLKTPCALVIFLLLSSHLVKLTIDVFSELSVFFNDQVQWIVHTTLRLLSIFLVLFSWTHFSIDMAVLLEHLTIPSFGYLSTCFPPYWIFPREFMSTRSR